MPYQHFSPITGCDIKHFAPGEVCGPEEYQAGDFILTHTNSLYGRLIRFGQRLRFRDADRPYAWWNHTALFVNKNGDLVEAIDAGVRSGNIKEYVGTEYHIVRLRSLADDHDREQMVTFANWCLNEPYGWFTIASIAISLVSGSTLAFGFEGQAICSGLVARALERGNAIFNRSPSHIMPADLAKYFGVKALKGWTKKDRGSLKPRLPFFKAVLKEQVAERIRQAEEIGQRVTEEIGKEMKK